MPGCGCFIGVAILLIVLAVIIFAGGILFLGGAALVIVIGPILMFISFLIIRWLWDLFW